jgi:hypothetical protein
MHNITLVLLILIMLIAPTRPARAADDPAALVAAERDIAGLSVEVAIGFNSRGKQLWRVEGDDNGVTPSYRQGVLLRGGYSTHNHPGEGRCVGLTVADVYFAYFYGAKEERAVSAENGVTWVARLRHPRHITQARFDAVRVKYTGDGCGEYTWTWKQLGMDYEVYPE